MMRRGVVMRRVACKRGQAWGIGGFECAGCKCGGRGCHDLGWRQGANGKVWGRGEGLG